MGLLQLGASRWQVRSAVRSAVAPQRGRGAQGRTEADVQTSRSLCGPGRTVLTQFCFCCAQKKAEAGAYHKLVMQRLKEQRERRSESLAKKRAVRMASQASSEAREA